MTSDDIAARFAQLGFPVDAIERRPRLSGVLGRKIGRASKSIPAPTVYRCARSTSLGPRTLTIATAATNVATGDVVPVATIGAELVGLTIAPRKMRGIDSEGMLCSAEELGLEAAWFEDGILQLDEALTIGADFIETFRLNDDVLDVEITANRVDAMSIVGLARELAASLGVPVREPRTEIERYHSVATPDARVSIESADCTRFVAQRFSDVRVRTSPFWMRVRLALAGQRPIDNLVDISNFVMLETAQPLHFYDFDALAGGELVARDARAGETIRTLDGNGTRPRRAFSRRSPTRERPQSVAGLMGGATSEVTPKTRELLVEAATFSGPRVRRMSVALGMRTEASSRHEKGLPRGLAPWGAARAAHLLQLEGRRRCTRRSRRRARHAEATPAIRVPLDRFAALLGIEIAEGDALAALRHLGFTAQAAVADDQIGEAPRHCIDVAPPFWRGDVRIAEDVVEEIARIVGYDRIVAQMPPVFEQDVDRAQRIATSRASRTRSRRSAIARPSPSRCNPPRRATPTCAPASIRARRSRSSTRSRKISATCASRSCRRCSRSRHVSRGRAVSRLRNRTRLRGRPGATRDARASRGSRACRSADEPAWRDGGFLAFKGDAYALVRALTGRMPETVTATLAGLASRQNRDSCSSTAATSPSIGAVDPRLCAAFGVRRGHTPAGCASRISCAYRAPRYARRRSIRP